MTEKLNLIVPQHIWNLAYKYKEIAKLPYVVAANEAAKLWSILLTIVLLPKTLLARRSILNTDKLQIVKLVL